MACCHDCRFFALAHLVAKESPAHGPCLRHAPILGRELHRAEWPWVRGTDWCGDHEPASPPAAEIEVFEDEPPAAPPADVASLCAQGHVWPNDAGDDWYPDDDVPCACGQRVWRGGRNGFGYPRPT